MSDTVQNGKGDRPRNNFSEEFRKNFEAINWRKKPAAARHMKGPPVQAAEQPSPFLPQTASAEGPSL